MSRYSIILDMIFHRDVKSQKKNCIKAKNLLVILLNLARSPRNSFDMNVESYISL